LVTSYSTLLWWDNAGPAQKRTAAHTRDVTTARLIDGLLAKCRLRADYKLPEASRSIIVDDERQALS
jgi:hypothetical protein